MLSKWNFFNMSLLLANTVIMDILKQGITDLKTTKSITIQYNVTYVVNFRRGYNL
jgi:hypothetical protein